MAMIARNPARRSWQNTTCSWSRPSPSKITDAILWRVGAAGPGGAWSSSC
jgi:hypothetical protein